MAKENRSTSSAVTVTAVLVKLLQGWGIPTPQQAPQERHSFFFTSVFSLNYYCLPLKTPREM